MSSHEGPGQGDRTGEGQGWSEPIGTPAPGPGEEEAAAEGQEAGGEEAPASEGSGEIPDLSYLYPPGHGEDGEKQERLRDDPSLDDYWETPRGREMFENVIWRLAGRPAKGEPLGPAQPVGFMEGVGGFLLDVLGLWRFEMRKVFGHVVEVTACIVEGCTTEFLMGLDFLKKHHANMDFAANEVRYFEKEILVVIPFRTAGGGTDENRVAPVRLARQVKLARNAVTLVTVAIVAPDGEQGIFVPTQNSGVVMLATTVTKVSDGKAPIPSINLRVDRTRLPNKKELGVWIPLEDDMELHELNGELETPRIDNWIKALGDTETPLESEDEARVGVDDPDTRTRVITLLRSYL